MAAEHVDVLIVGAGLSGIGTAAHLARAVPGASLLILESRGVSGGTWDLFRYPGTRTDSDAHTYGYSFKPWNRDTTLAPAADILDYILDTAREYSLGSRIRHDHRVTSASWSSVDARWTVSAVHTDPTTGVEEPLTLTAGWLFGATGYFRYDRGYTPDFARVDDFAGRVVHPQLWPDDLDYVGKQVVVIGSGATAVTMIPAMADDVAHITMLQRSPTYVMPLPSNDRVGGLLRTVLNDDRAYAITRRKNIAQSGALYKLFRRFPKQARGLIRRVNVSQLPPGYDVDAHFSPSYDPWDQRLCVAPDGDLFAAIRSGKAAVVTDTIDRFVPEGVQLASGRVLPADIIVTATGLDLMVLGGIELDVDGLPVDVTQRLAYKGARVSNVPNFAFAIGYTNASWTLKVDLVAEFVCRVLLEMHRRRTDTVTPVLADVNVPTRPLLDFGAGYVQRALDRLPRAGLAEPWGLPMDYRDDVRMLRTEPLLDGVLRFTRRREAAL